ncbi:MAG: hypothetical protein KF886_13380 [Candidatus Hydrogenedentes bacterium]|nr:hypothetical protein [Candidatus Hydrogenedentota bacterium]
MNSHVTAEFRRLFMNLPNEVRQRARHSYLLWKENPAHPGVQFKRVHRRQPIYSVRIGIDWRAVGLRQGETIIWFWIGSHAEYDALLKRL